MGILVKEDPMVVSMPIEILSVFVHEGTTKVS
jgi:hypothetical protein